MLGRVFTDPAFKQDFGTQSLLCFLFFLIF